MHNGILAELTKLVSPPRVPTHSKGDWRQVEADLGLQLPSDYKRLVETYGLVEFCDYLTVMNPFTGRPYRKNAADIIDQWSAVAELCSVEYPLYPEEGGLLPCCVNVNAHYVSWRTQGSPEGWELIVWDSSEPNYVPTGFKSLVELLASILSLKSALVPLLTPSLLREPQRSPWLAQYKVDPATGQSSRVKTAEFE